METVQIKIQIRITYLNYNNLELPDQTLFKRRTKVF